jgi:hypothetical protein
MSERTENDSLIDAVKASRARIEDIRGLPDGIILYSTHDGIKNVDVRPLLPAPPRVRKTLAVHTTDAFAKYLEELDDSTVSDTVRIYADITRSMFTAILDDDSNVSPGWREHRVELKLAPHPMFTHWFGGSGVLVPQAKFVEHLNLGRNCVIDPDAATLLEISSHLEGVKNAKWESGTRSRDGSIQFAYIEETSARTKNGAAELPQSITLRLRPYIATEATIDVIADLSYAIKDGELSLRYTLVDLPDHLETLFGDITRQLEAMTDRHILAATAPAPATV